VHRVNPKDRTGTLAADLAAIGQPIDVVDLIINPRDGLPLIAQAADLGIKMVFVQPGAGSEAIEELCVRRGMAVHHGCVLREL